MDDVRNDKPLVFIASPFRDASLAQMIKNVAYAQTLSQDVWAFGGVPISPVLNSWFLYGALDEDTVAQDYEILIKKCDLFWKAGLSPGVEAEAATARRMGKPVCGSLASLVDAIKAFGEEDHGAP